MPIKSNKVSLIHGFIHRVLHLWIFCRCWHIMLYTDIRLLFYVIWYTMISNGIKVLALHLDFKESCSKGAWHLFTTRFIFLNVAWCQASVLYHETLESDNRGAIKLDEQQFTLKKFDISETRKSHTVFNYYLTCLFIGTCTEVQWQACVTC